MKASDAKSDRESRIFGECRRERRGQILLPSSNPCEPTGLYVTEASTSTADAVGSAAAPSGDDRSTSSRNTRTWHSALKPKAHFSAADVQHGHFDLPVDDNSFTDFSS